MQKTMYVAMCLVKSLSTSLGEMKVEGVEGRAGFVPVFYTKTAARKLYGQRVKLVQIQVDSDP